MAKIRFDFSPVLIVFCVLLSSLCSSCFSGTATQGISNSELIVPEMTLDPARLQRIRSQREFRCVLSYPAQVPESVRSHEQRLVRQLADRLNLSVCFVTAGPEKTAALLRNGMADLAAGAYSMETVLANGMVPVESHSVNGSLLWLMMPSGSNWIQEIK